MRAGCWGLVGAVDPKDLGDAIAEICDMVAGNFKAKNTQLAKHCLLSVPTDFRRYNYYILNIPVETRIIIWIAHEGGPLWVCPAIHS